MITATGKMQMQMFYHGKIIIIIIITVKCADADMVTLTRLSISKGTVS